MLPSGGPDKNTHNVCNADICGKGHHNAAPVIAYFSRLSLAIIHAVCTTHTDKQYSDSQFKWIHRFILDELIQIDAFWGKNGLFDSYAIFGHVHIVQ